MAAQPRDDWGVGLDASTVSPSPLEAAPAQLLVPGLTILGHPNPARVGERVALPGLGSGPPVPLSRLTPTFAQPGAAEARALADPHLSRTPVVLAPGRTAGCIALEGAAGACTVWGGPSLPCELSPADLDAGVVLLLAGRVCLLLHRMVPVVPEEPELFGLLGASAAALYLRGEIRRAAGLPAPVLLRGETGTGKELAARALHAAGPRRHRPFVAVNLGAVPPPLAAAELFGAARGAFTGADHRRTGYFSRAAGGTLFLDEIGEVPVEVQVLLLRALESGEVQAVGGEAMEKVDVRIVAATDADLEGAVGEGRFRAPLLHRLNGYEIRLPPLRERRDDIGRLLLGFLTQELAAVGEAWRLADPGPHGQPWLPAERVAELASHTWPGNVRELRNAARQIVGFSRGAAVAQVPPQLMRQWQGAEAPAPPPGRPAGAARPAWRSPSEVGEEELLAALEVHGWKPAAAAAQLGIARSSLYELLARWPHLRRAADLTAEEIAAALDRSGGRLDRAAEDLQVSPHGLRLRRTRLGMR